MTKPEGSRRSDRIVLIVSYYYVFIKTTPQAATLVNNAGEEAQRKVAAAMAARHAPRGGDIGVRWTTLLRACGGGARVLRPQHGHVFA